MDGWLAGGGAGWEGCMDGWRDGGVWGRWVWMVWMVFGSVQEERSESKKRKGNQQSVQRARKKDGRECGGCSFKTPQRIL